MRATSDAQLIIGFIIFLQLVRFGNKVKLVEQYKNCRERMREWLVLCVVQIHCRSENIR